MSSPTLSTPTDGHADELAQLDAAIAERRSAADAVTVQLDNFEQEYSRLKQQYDGLTARLTELREAMSRGNQDKTQHLRELEALTLEKNRRDRLLKQFSRPPLTMPAAPSGPGMAASIPAAPAPEATHPLAPLPAFAPVMQPVLPAFAPVMQPALPAFAPVMQGAPRQVGPAMQPAAPPALPAPETPVVHEVHEVPAAAAPPLPAASVPQPQVPETPVAPMVPEAHAPNLQPTQAAPVAVSAPAMAAPAPAPVAPSAPAMAAPAPAPVVAPSQPESPRAAATPPALQSAAIPPNRPAAQPPKNGAAPQTRHSGAIRPKRRRPPVAVEVEFGGDSNLWVGFSENLAEGGIFVATYSPRAVGERVNMNVTLEGIKKVFAFEGEVTWQIPYRGPLEEKTRVPGMGVRFLNVAPSDLELMTRFARKREPLFFPS